MFEISKAGNADIQPLMFTMRCVDLLTSWRRKTLHCIVASTKEQGTQRVDG